MRSDTYIAIKNLNPGSNIMYDGFVIMRKVKTSKTEITRELHFYTTCRMVYGVHPQAGVEN